MKLSELLKGLDAKILQGPADPEVTDVVNDSRKVSEGALFLCVKGAVSDGHQYAEAAAAQGAAVLVVEDPVHVPETVTVVQVKNSRYAMALIAAAYYGHPADKLKVIGITGTKGKTTTAYMVKAILERAGYRVGLIGTIETIIGDEVTPNANTTPESLLVQSYFARMVEEGCTICVMEVSSQAFKLDRVAGFTFEIGVFTNLEPDHIGPAEHADFEEYLSCKRQLFRQCRIGILNADDPHLEAMLEGHTCQVETYGFDQKADLQADQAKLVTGKGYLGIAYELKGSMQFPVTVDIPGRFSVYNSMAAIAVSRHFAVTKEVICSAMLDMKVKGRVEMVNVSDEFTLMIDYAHNAMALESLLGTLQAYRPHRLVCLFGCGGNRSKLRRFEMGEIAGKMADLTIITSDNPRFEEPSAIIDDIVTGIEKTDGKYVRIEDRREAIRYAIHHGEPGDIVVLAGKGHEDYQEIKGKKYPMDERVIIADILAEDAAGTVS